ncbi:MAG: TIGR02444 family protein [Pseudorhodoplanes sp.]|uniref:TIGR02444 family protein n=1 Tax=Pseudorhodoplanes sp. TaxID=1934341 RepID=UPI003D0EF539
MAPLAIDNPFWQFSLRVYAAPGVAAECLELQDKLGIDVNVVLFAVWLGAVRGVVLERADLDRIDRAVVPWAAEVVRPLRTVRQRLKQMPEIDEPEVQALRKRVADVELFSEQLEQARLFRLADDLGQSQAMTKDGTARANAMAILAAHGAEVDAFPLARLLAASGAVRD